MKNKIILFLIIMAITIKDYSQDLPAFKYEPYFSAVIVSNLDSSMRWYGLVFGLKVKNEIDDPQNGFRIFILESSTFSLELLELKGSLLPREILSGKPDGTQIQGHFKIGFKVPDIDACLKYLVNLKINVPKVWTDSSSMKRNFLISDPDGNLIQFFE